LKVPLVDMLSIRPMGANMYFNHHFIGKAVASALRAALAASGAVLLIFSGTQTLSAAETRSYVVSWFHFAPYNTAADCPDGVNPKADKIFLRVLNELGKTPEEIKKAMDDDWVNHMNMMAGQRGKIDGKWVDVYVNPTSVPDPHIKTGQGHVGLGFNLDGKDSPDNYVDPQTGEHGVDNEFFRVVACTDTQQGTLNARPVHSSIVWDALRDQMPAWLIEISGIDDIQNDNDVEVKISRAIEPITRNAEGLPQADMTFRVDPNPRSISTVHGHIKNGLLTTDKFDFNMIGDPYVMPEYHGRDTRLRLQLAGDNSGKGILGAYFPWKDLYQAWAFGGAVNESNLSMDLPGLYYALRRMADGYPDPKTGQNTMISTSYVVEVVPAFIKHVDEASLIAASRVLPMASTAPLLSPPGVTFKSVKLGQTKDPLTRGAEASLVFADDKGMPLYASDKNMLDKSACVGDCTKTWLPFLAPNDAKPVGDWSIVKGGGGAKQWALRGKPLFTYAPDKPAPFVVGMAGVMLMGYGGAPDARGHGVDGSWHAQMVVPTDSSQPLPREIGIREVLDAPGIALVNSRGLSLYTFDAKKGSAQSLGPEWQPVMAPLTATAVPNFSIVKRRQGDLQWAYKGKPLYTYSGDRELNDANGKNVDDRVHIAVVARYFTPAEVQMRENERRGGILIEASTGKTLYARDRTFHNHTGGHNARGFTRGSPAVGVALGTTTCSDDACERDWKPLSAPTDARASGYWSVFDRKDGTKQWAYQGYALYTYEKEKPGETFQNDSFTVMINDDTHNLAPPIFGLGLYWREVSP
jgi:predicted lipoprotein with Yx(FWY)xxD motif